MFKFRIYSDSLNNNIDIFKTYIQDSSHLQIEKTYSSGWGGGGGDTNRKTENNWNLYYSDNVGNEVEQKNIFKLEGLQT